MWRKIIHELIVSHNKIAPELIPADIFPVQKENEVIQDRISSPEESVKQRLEQHLELALQLELRGLRLIMGKKSCHIRFIPPRFPVMMNSSRRPALPPAVRWSPTACFAAEADFAAG